MMANTHTTSENNTPQSAAENHSRPVLASVLCCVALISFLSLWSYHHTQGTSPLLETSNLCGSVGSFIARFCIHSWGIVAFMLPLFLALLASAYFFRQPQQLGLRIAGAALMLSTACGIVHILPIQDMDSIHGLLHSWDIQHLGIGGNIGHLLCAEQSQFRTALGTTGSTIMLCALFIASFFLLRIGFIALWKRLIRSIRSHRERRTTALRPQSRKAPHDIVSTPTPTASHSNSKPSQTSIQALTADVTVPRSSTVEDVHNAVAKRDKKVTTQYKRHTTDHTGDVDGSVSQVLETIAKHRQAIHDDDASNTSLSAIRHESDAQSADVHAEKATATQPVTTQATVNEAPASEKTALTHKTLPSNKPTADIPTPTPVAAVTAEVVRKRTGDPYDLPGEELLEAAPPKNNDAADEETADTSRKIEGIFASFKVNVSVVAATRGPVITQYELELLDAGMRVSKVSNLEQELCLNLGTEGVRIVAPLPNKKTIGVEVPNTLKEVVVMRDLVNETDISQYTLPLILGRDVLGDAMIGDLAKMPHLLVAGATGMGKSVCLNSIICSILLFKDPSDVKFILVDPKMVELAPYEEIPHLLTPPITDMTKAHAALEWACTVMDCRYMALRLAGVRDIKSFNALGEEELLRRLAKKEKTIADLDYIDEPHMPYIIIVVDEYADLMMVNKEVEKSIVRLTAKSRACGIHIILTTQRPSADVVTGLIKSNLPSRISFRVADKNNSRVVLDCGGAENLIGRGDMLFLAPGTSNPLRGQGVWVKDQEIDAIIEHVRAQGEPQYDESITSIGAVAMSGGNSDKAGGGFDWVNDRQFHEAVHTMYQHERSGADFLRRKLGVGYNKATTYVETLEDLGFLSEQNGTRPRDFLQTWENWMDLLVENNVPREEHDEIYMSPF